MAKYKKCPKCKKEKLVSHFNRKGKTGYSSWCKLCNKKNLKKHYKDNPEYYKQKRTRLRHEIRDKVLEYKSQFKCKCGEDDPACLVFHHKDPTKKEMNLSGVTNFTWNWSKIEKEIKNV